MFGAKLSNFTRPFHLILARIITQSVGFLLTLFTFVGNEFNQASATKRSKRGTKEEKKAGCGRVVSGGTTAIGQPCIHAQGVAKASLS